MKVAVVIPNWNGAELITTCLHSLEKQTIKAEIIVVDNGSHDESVQIIKSTFPKTLLQENHKNLGFARGVNQGIKKAMALDVQYVALFNNDAEADAQWLERLVRCLDEHPDTAIATCKFLNSDGKKIDSTSERYTVWGLSYPRGRDEPVSDKYDKQKLVFGASGGASLYRVEALKEIGLFDEGFFAYYEDVDISFRAQLAGWKVRYVPEAIATHQISATTGKIKGFATYHTIKNLPLLLWKNVPRKLLPTLLPRFIFAHKAFVFSAIARGEVWPAIKGVAMATWLLPGALVQRHRIQRKRKVSPAYIASILVWDLPPNAYKLRRLRTGWQRFLRKS